MDVVMISRYLEGSKLNEIPGLQLETGDSNPSSTSPRSAYSPLIHPIPHRIRVGVSYGPLKKPVSQSSVQKLTHMVGSHTGP